MTFPGLFRSLDHAARYARAGVAGGIRFQVVVLFVNHDRLADDRICATQTHFPLPIEMRLAGGVRFEIAKVTSVTFGGSRRAAVMLMRRIKMRAG